MKQIKEEIKKVFEKNNINIDDYNLKDFLREQQQKYIREIIKEENVLNINFDESEINTIINKYELYNIEDLKRIIKNHFSKYSTEDLKKQLLKNFHLKIEDKHLKKLTNEKIQTYTPRSLFHFSFRTTIKDLKNFYEYLQNYLNEDIVFKHYCFNYKQDIDDYKVLEYENNFKKLLEIVFKDDKINDFKATYYKNGNVKIKFSDEKLHKKIKNFFITEELKQVRKEFFILQKDIQKEQYKYIKRLTIYKDENEQIYIRLNLNIFEYEKLKNEIKLNEMFNLSLNCVVDLNFSDLKDNFKQYSYKKIDENISNKDIKKDLFIFLKQFE